MNDEIVLAQDILEYAKHKKWFNAGITYLHENEVRTSYFRAQVIEDAIKQFKKVSDDKIIQAFLFDAEDVTEWIERR